VQEQRSARAEECKSGGVQERRSARASQEIVCFLSVGVGVSEVR
jgi:hypothetical protein